MKKYKFDYTSIPANMKEDPKGVWIHYSAVVEQLKIIKESNPERIPRLIENLIKELSK